MRLNCATRFSAPSKRRRKSRIPRCDKALLTFVIVGGGPTGVEFAGALQELIYHVLYKDYP